MRRVILLALLLCLASPAGAFRAGQTIEFHFTPRGLDGIAETPSWLKAYVWRGTTCIDSTKGFGVGPGGTLSGISRRIFGGGKLGDTFYWTWDVPTAYGTLADYYSGILHVQVRYSMTGIVRDEDDAVPTLVPVNAATVDTLTADAIQDFWRHATSSTSATITPGDAYGSSAVTSSGSPVVNARVYLQGANTPSSHYTVGYDTSDTDGEFVIVVPVNPAAADTFYIWATKDRVWQKQGQRVIVP